MSYSIPIGPYHIALEEPYKIEVECEGENVIGSSLKVGFNFRGIEWLAQRKNITKSIALLERVCGICSNVHSMSFCMTLERIGNIEVPERGQHIRMVMAELERLHSHMLWAGVASELIGFETLFMQIFRLRESVMDALESISGNRVNYSMNRIGGVNRDLLDDAKVREVIHGIRAITEGTLIPLLTTDQTVIARCQGVGVLTRQDAIAYGVVGPVARASGVNTDLRRDQPYLAYDKIDFSVPVQTAGDVLARVVVRALEILESCKIIDQVLDRMPEGPIHAGDIYSVPAGNAVVRIEAPRGEVFYYLVSNGSDTPLRVKVRTPSFANIPSVAAMVMKNTIADVPLIQAALDPCYSCTDR
ncbi:MAG: nickel-dependent hydrogenase large subunit [Terracidiphilus sp.]|nr:nickel-dependent hydrogenase large subunit [Terracidiphilus sp.]MDR3776125.1 nickel-dependent hydrogenase large subunit [Terracidiphilus sp.]